MYMNVLTCMIMVMIMINSYSHRPGGTGPVGPTMARPTFELGRIFFSSIKKKILN